jgi:hypothetical protein
LASAAVPLDQLGDAQPAMWRPPLTLDTCDENGRIGGGIRPGQIGERQMATLKCASELARKNLVEVRSKVYKIHG